MAESEIKILVRAVDDVSASLKNIEGKIDNFSKNTTKQTEKVTNSFFQSTTTLLALGNAALTVENIFSSYVNLQIRLENATERVTGAQERLRFAQDKYNEILKDTEGLQIRLLKNSRKEKQITEELEEARKQLAEKDKRGVLPTSKSYVELLERISDKEIELREIQYESRRAREQNAKSITDASREIEQAQRALTISQNNLERANNQVLGTYINIGVQIVSLTASIPLLIKNISLLTGTTTGLTSAVGLGGLAATAGTAGALAGLFFVMNKIGEGSEVSEFQKAIDARIVSLQQVRDAAKDTEKAFFDLLIQEQKVRSIQFKAGVGGTRTDLPTPQFPKGQFILPPVTIQKDFISRPGQAPVPFSPADTIIGMKNPEKMNNTVNVFIDNVYGINSSDISRSLRNELSKKITIGV